MTAAVVILLFILWAMDPGLGFAALLSLAVIYFLKWIWPF